MQIHPFKGGLMEIYYNADTSTLQTSIRLFTDDLEDALEEVDNSRKPRLGSRREHRDANKWISQYTKQNVVFYVNDKVIDYAFIGYKVGIHETWLYLETDSLSGMISLDIQNSLLTELFIAQENHIQFIYNQQTHGGVCTYDRPKSRVYPSL